MVTNIGEHWVYNNPISEFIRIFHSPSLHLQCIWSLFWYNFLHLVCWLSILFISSTVLFWRLSHCSLFPDFATVVHYAHNYLPSPFYWAHTFLNLVFVLEWGLWRQALNSTGTFCTQTVTVWYYQSITVGVQFLDKFPKWPSGAIWKLSSNWNCSNRLMNRPTKVVWSLFVLLGVYV